MKSSHILLYASRWGQVAQGEYFGEVYEALTFFTMHHQLLIAEIEQGGL